MKVKPSTRVPIFGWLTGELPDEHGRLGHVSQPGTRRAKRKREVGHHLLSLSRDVARRHDGPIVVERAGACREH
jgi:hypothetical protein